METGTTGIDPLDAVLGGLFWGDNVVWEAPDTHALTPFVAAAARVVSRYPAATWVVLNPSTDVPRGFTRLDATAGGPLAQPRPLLEEVRRRCVAEPRQLVMFDPLPELVARWGAETTGRFFVHACPMLLGIGAIAYWQLTTDRGETLVRRRVAEVTQCILTVGDGAVRISKAESRPPAVEGAVFRYRVDESGLPQLEDAPATARLSFGLKALRRDRRLSQANVARLAGVSPSAISQAERGERGLSLETLLTLTDRLGITLDDLLRGSASGPGYRISRRDDPRRDVVDAPVPLLDDPHLGIRAYVLRMRPGSSATPGFAHKGVEVVAVAQGLVQVVLATGRPVLRHGETLVAESSGVEGWRNLSDREALAFWILRD